MAATRQARLAPIGAASVALHALFFAGLALQHSHLVVREPPEQVFDVSIVPRFLSEQAAKAPTPIRPRLAKPSVEPPNIAPLLMTPRPAPPSPRVSETPQAQSEPIAGDVSALGKALRSGGLGCRNQVLSGLSQEERARCLERLGSGARGSPYYRPGIDPSKQAILDASGEKKSLQWKRDREQITAFGHITTDGGPTMRPIPDTNPTPKGPREIRVPF